MNNNPPLQALTSLNSLLQSQSIKLGNKLGENYDATIKPGYSTTKSIVFDQTSLIKSIKISNSTTTQNNSRLNTKTPNKFRVNQTIINNNTNNNNANSNNNSTAASKNIEESVNNIAISITAPTYNLIDSSVVDKSIPSSSTDNNSHSHSHPHPHAQPPSAAAATNPTFPTSNDFNSFLTALPPSRPRTSNNNSLAIFAEQQTGEHKRRVSLRPTQTNLSSLISNIVQVNVNNNIDKANQQEEKNAKPIPFRLQGNRSFYTKKALQARGKLQKHPLITQQIDRFWSIFLNQGQRFSIDKFQYTSLHMSICKILWQHEFNIEIARKLAETDWKKDCMFMYSENFKQNDNNKRSSLSQSESNSLNKSAFYRSIFEIADQWTVTIELQDYVNFLSDLFERVTTIDNKTGNRVFKEHQEINNNYLENYIVPEGGEKAAKIIQKNWRIYRENKRNKAARIIQLMWREKKEKLRKIMKSREEAARIIQKWARMTVLRKYYAKKIAAENARRYAEKLRIEKEKMEAMLAAKQAEIEQAISTNVSRLATPQAGVSRQLSKESSQKEEEKENEDEIKEKAAIEIQRWIRSIWKKKNKTFFDTSKDKTRKKKNKKKSKKKKVEEFNANNHNEEYIEDSNKLEREEEIAKVSEEIMFKSEIDLKQTTITINGKFVLPKFSNPPDTTDSDIGPLIHPDHTKSTENQGQHAEANNEKYVIKTRAEAMSQFLFNLASKVVAKQQAAAVANNSTIDSNPSTNAPTTISTSSLSFRNHLSAAERVLLKLRKLDEAIALMEAQLLKPERKKKLEKLKQKRNKLHNQKVIKSHSPRNKPKKHFLKAKRIHQNNSNNSSRYNSEEEEEIIKPKKKILKTRIIKKENGEEIKEEYESEETDQEELAKLKLKVKAAKRRKKAKDDISNQYLSVGSGNHNSGSSTPQSPRRERIKKKNKKNTKSASSSAAVSSEEEEEDEDVRENLLKSNTLSPLLAMRKVKQSTSNSSKSSKNNIKSPQSKSKSKNENNSAISFDTNSDNENEEDDVRYSDSAIDSEIDSDTENYSSSSNAETEEDEEDAHNHSGINSSQSRSPRHLNVTVKSNSKLSSPASPRSRSNNIQFNKPSETPTNHATETSEQAIEQAEDLEEYEYYIDPVLKDENGLPIVRRRKVVKSKQQSLTSQHTASVTTNHQTTPHLPTNDSWNLSGLQTRQKIALRQQRAAQRLKQRDFDRLYPEAANSFNNFGIRSQIDHNSGRIINFAVQKNAMEIMAQDKWNQAHAEDEEEKQIDHSQHLAIRAYQSLNRISNLGEEAEENTQETKQLSTVSSSALIDHESILIQAQKLRPTLYNHSITSNNNGINNINLYSNQWAVEKARRKALKIAEIAALKAKKVLEAAYARQKNIENRGRRLKANELNKDDDDDNHSILNHSNTMVNDPSQDKFIIPNKVAIVAPELEEKESLYNKYTKRSQQSENATNDSVGKKSELNSETVTNIKPTQFAADNNNDIKPSIPINTIVTNNIQTPAVINTHHYSHSPRPMNLKMPSELLNPLLNPSPPASNPQHYHPKWLNSSPTLYHTSSSANKHVNSNNSDSNSHTTTTSEVMSFPVVYAGSNNRGESLVAAQPHYSVQVSRSAIENLDVHALLAGKKGKLVHGYAPRPLKSQVIETPGQRRLKAMGNVKMKNQFLNSSNLQVSPSIVLPSIPLQQISSHNQALTDRSWYRNPQQIVNSARRAINPN